MYHESLLELGMDDTVVLSNITNPRLQLKHGDWRDNVPLYIRERWDELTIPEKLLIRYFCTNFSLTTRKQDVDNG